MDDLSHRAVQVMYLDGLIDEPGNDCRQTREGHCARAWQRNSQVLHGSGMRSVMARSPQRLSLLDQMLVQHGAVTLAASTVEKPHHWHASVARPLSAWARLPLLQWSQDLQMPVIGRRVPTADERMGLGWQ